MEEQAARRLEAARVRNRKLGLALGAFTLCVMAFPVWFYDVKRKVVEENKDEPRQSVYKAISLL